MSGVEGPFFLLLFSYKFRSTYKRPYKFGSTYERTYGRTYKIRSTDESTCKLGSTYKRSYVRFFALEPTSFPKEIIIWGKYSWTKGKYNIWWVWHYSVRNLYYKEVIADETVRYHHILFHQQCKTTLGLCTPPKLELRKYPDPHSLSHFPREDRVQWGIFLPSIRDKNWLIKAAQFYRKVIFIRNEKVIFFLSWLLDLDGLSWKILIEGCLFFQDLEEQRK